MPARASDYNVKGRWDWVDASKWGDELDVDGKLVKGGGTHMALLRGAMDEPWVLHFHRGVNALLWRPTTPTDIEGVKAEVPLPADSMEVFCSGHATLADGRLLVVNGARVSETGEKRCATFDATNYTSAGKGWRLVRRTAQGHWYPTATTRGDGTVVAMGGWEWKNMVLFGGAVDGSPAPVNEMRVLNLSDTTHWNEDPIAGLRPLPRHSHSTVYWNGFDVLFGGDLGTPPTSTLTDSLWRLWGNDIDAGRRWGWDRPSVQGSLPPARSRHTAVMSGDTMIVFGGQAANGSGLNDVWWVDLSPSAANPPQPIVWNQASISGDLPPNRYGHTAVLARDKWAQPQMLVYGGRNQEGFVGDTVWALIVPKNVNGGGGATAFSWTPLITTTTSPGEREGHSAIIHPLGTTYRMMVFGGNKESEGLKNDAFKFDLLSTGSSTWGTQPTNGTPPSARTRHAAAWDKEWHRMVIYGGDGNTGAGGELGDMHGLPLEYPSGTNPTWSAMNPDTIAPAARWGHTLTFDIRGYDARFAERYNPVAPGDIGIWEKHDVEPKWLPPYPFMFNLTDGSLFFGGNGPEHVPLTNSYLYSVGTESWSGQETSGSLGGSAVMWPAVNDSDRVMKCGGDDDVTNQDEKQTRLFTVGSTDWIAGGSLPESRTYHNLTLLPDGRVLLTGGRKRSGAHADFTTVPRLWDPVTNGWPTDAAVQLNPDLGNRGYHSTALLLPDARVLCAGGPGVGSGDWRGSIFTPPYLYKDGTTLADRPTITSYPSHTIHYGEPLYFNIGNLVGGTIDSIKILCLIRSGAPTHGFDQNQRYHKLSFTKTYGYLRSVLTGNPELLPPGDYLLFAVRTGVGGVPSVAKWVRVASEDDDEPPDAATLDIAVAGNTAFLLWGSQGDDGSGPGAATSWEVRSASFEITSANWGSATTFATGIARPSNTTESLSFTSQAGVWYAVKTFDEGGNPSPVSNSVQDPGAGGGGLAARRVADDFGSQSSASRSMGGVSTTLLRVGRDRGPHSLTIYNPGPNPLRVDSVSVVGACDLGDTLVFAVDGDLRVGIRRLPAFVSSSLAGDVTGTFAGSAAHAAMRGETLTLGPPDGAQHLLIETVSADPANGPEAAGVGIELPSGEAWTRSGVRYPVVDGDGWFEPGVAADSVRLVMDGGYALSAIAFVEPLAVQPTVAPRSIELVHSRLGSLAAPGIPNEETHLLAGERLTLTVTGAPEEATPDRLFVTLATSTGIAPQSRAQGVGRLVPTRFDLSQNEPNPFGAGTVIRFALPVASEVKVEVFDLHGRRMMTLAQGEWPAGHHTLEWNGRDASGRRLRPGVYLYRMHAGLFRASRKLVVLP